MKNRILILLTVWLTVAARGVAQPYCDVRNFTLRDGLPASNISRIIQTDNGLIWFSTWNGLCCYDGYRFTTFRNRPGANDVLTTNRMFLIKPSATGDIWCCTYDRNVYLLDTRQCRYINVSEIIKKKFDDNIFARNVYSLANGHTWVVSNNGGANYRIDDVKVKSGEGIERFDGKASGGRYADVKKAELDDSGREWIFCDNGVVLYGGEFDCDVTFEHMGQLGKTVLFASYDGRFYAYDGKSPKPRKIAMPAGVSRINDMVKLDDRRMLLATDAGVICYDISRNSLHGYSVHTPAHPSAAVTDIFVDAQKRIWAYTADDGIIMINGSEASPRWLMSNADNAIKSTTSAKPFFHEDKYGTVWTVPNGGTFSYYDEAEQKLVPYVLKSGTGSGAFLSTIDKFFIDKDKNLWFTSTRDISLVNFRYRRFKYIPVLPNQEVRSLLTDSRGNTWAGTYEGQLALFDADSRLLGYIGKDGSLQKGKTNFANRIYALREDNKGRVWIGTKGDGVYVLYRDGTLRHYTNSTTDVYSLSNNDIYDIDIDNRNHIWIASFDGGLNLVDESGGKIRFINYRNDMKQYPDSLYIRKVRRVTHDNKGAVILSTSGGLVSFSDDFSRPDKIHFYINQHVRGDETSLMGNDVMQTLVTRNGKVVVVTMGGGVQELVSASVLGDDLKFGSLTDVHTDDNNVQSVVEDNKGDVWIIREGSIEKYNPATGVLSQYGPNNIGYNAEMSEAKPVHNAATDAISVAVRGGFITFNPDELKKSDHIPGIIFTGVLWQGDNEMEPVLNRDVLEVPSDRRNLTVYFAALEYSDKYLVKYAYKLDGVDDKWNYVGETNSASFNYLPAGRHKLLVKSTNSDGIWVDNVAELNINVHPTFWETGWATLLYVLLSVCLICVAVYIYNLRTRAAMERELNDMKTRFFTEIGHKLRTPLTLIGGPVTEILNGGNLTDTARKHLEMVERNASHMLELVNKMLKYSMDRKMTLRKGRRYSDDWLSDEAGAHSKSEHPHPLLPAGDLLPASESNTVSDTRSSGDLRQPKELKLLVVEDNEDLRDFLVCILHEDYNVLQAENGRRGLEIAETEMPDFIITDVMMPEMNGLEMVRRIKCNNDICHIPIIVLSAKSSLEDRLHGLETGIDDYITKPFSAIYLKSRVRNIIRQRHLLQQAYVEQIKPDDNRTYKLETPQIVDADTEMMKSLLGYLEEHISDPNMKIEDLAAAVNLGRSVFYGKIKSIVGMAPVDFVRHIRMQRAEELIAKSNYPFSQIAYMVGFSDPKYFSKCFKKETGMTPSEYRDKAG